MAAEPLDDEAIFKIAFRISSEDVRADYLQQACGDDQRLRDRVGLLLRLHAQDAGFLERPIGGAAATIDYPAIAERPGTQIGPYELVEVIGEGGMGVVYMAVQKEPVRRQVALKIIKPGMDTRQVIARFQAEELALALMDHPNIAKVLDAGVTPLGRPYFVMELVSGTPIGTYCDEHRLPIQERLELFVSVCHAIQHAHQKGIIHRDVKPSNVLIRLHEGRATAKVIDFGVAKVLFQQLSGDSVHTEFGQIIGTLEYMSPEQAGLSDLDIDTRADIYSLGVLLYELLTGTTPLDRRTQPGVSLTEILRVIREVEPPKPSSRLAQSQDALAEIAARRRTEPTRLERQVRGELDWIVMKCLELDRTRRYATAVALAQDIERHLSDEPVEVGPPSAMYRFRKLARRHKGPVLAASLVLLSLVGGIIGTSWGLVRAHASAVAEQQSNQRLGAANQQLSTANTDLSRSREETEQKRQTAEREKAVAQHVNEFLQELLSQADSDTQEIEGFAPDPNLTVKEALTRAAAKIGQRFQDQPRVEAATRQTIGAALTKIGEPEAAIPHLERARELWAAQPGADDDRLLCLIQLSSAYEGAGQLSRSLGLLEVTVAEAEKHRTPDDELMLMSMNNLAGIYSRMGRFDQAVLLLETIRKREVAFHGLNARRTLNVESNLALTYQKMGQIDKALPLMEQVADQGHLTAMSNLVFAYMQVGHPEKALPL